MGLTMGKMILMDTAENDRREEGNYVEFVLYRIPKKNHEPMLQTVRRIIDIVAKEDVRFDCFGLIGSEDLPGFTNITKTMSANPGDEEIWINMVSYKGRQHRDEIVAKISNDKESQEIYGKLMSLITPGSGLTNGEFMRLNA
ncbi:DUF1428 family protein [Candidatus Nitrosocosmicus arcticus]|uniref:DUF1428 domain-containing protein n=1 Tax=Candidatus Nitrosocosmicus arcticus TaxID=2035267 RepID=A0A557SQX3_9ARCH|nr:DUF1428 family protein [Candidatus Nitrosocosmicus arcticus]TVP39010.1 hypothetical protein NARC_240014 [Candidatus Nitrosocosmicus arcticus]